MKEIAEQMDNMTYVNKVHSEVLEAWINAKMVYNTEISLGNTKGIKSIWYFLSLMLAKTFINTLSRIEDFDMSRVKVYDWSSFDDQHGVSAVVTVDGYVYHTDIPNAKMSTRSNMDSLFINQAGKVALEIGICYYLENGIRNGSADYWMVTPWGDNTKYGEPYYSVQNKIYTAEEFLTLEKVK